MIELDGSYGEGGGALVRSALALSVITGQAIHVKHIRAGREKGGLKAQHLCAIEALKEICGATTNDIQLGSEELFFTPGTLRKGKYEIDIGTAGSITLLLQALLPALLFVPGKVTLTIKGGTCGKWQASVDFLQQILLPLVERFAQKLQLRILKRGYYPEGGGEVVLEITPQFLLANFNGVRSLLLELEEKVQPIMLIEQGKLEQVRGVINLSEQLAEREVGERLRSSLEIALADFNVPLSLRLDYAKTGSIGGEVLVWGVLNGKAPEETCILAASALLEKQKKAEEIAQNVALDLKRIIESGNCVDDFLQDQLIIFMALRIGSQVRVRELTEHTKTNIYVCEKMLPVRFTFVKGILSSHNI